MYNKYFLIIETFCMQMEFILIYFVFFKKSKDISRYNNLNLQIIIIIFKILTGI